MTDQSEPPPPRRKLPPWGMAEDLLGEGGSLAPRADEPGAIHRFVDSLAPPVAEADVVQHLETWVTFRIAAETYALPVTAVLEILRVEGITRVPHAPPSVRGITNMRGRVLPVMDLRARLGLGDATIVTASRIMVVASLGRSIGLLVDSVEQVARLDRLRFQAPPRDVMTEESTYIVGVYQLDDRPMFLLDVDRVLHAHADVRS